MPQDGVASGTELGRRGCVSGSAWAPISGGGNTIAESYATSVEGAPQRLPTTGLARRTPRTPSQWLEQHSHTLQNHFAGKWVAVTKDGVIAVGEDLAAVMPAARSHGTRAALVFEVPSFDRLKRAGSGHLG